MKSAIVTLSFAFAFSLAGTSHAQFGSGTSAGFGPEGQPAGTAHYEAENGFAHSLSDHRSGFVRSSAIGVSETGEISYSRSIAQRDGDQTRGMNLQVLNGSQGSHFSGGEIIANGPISQVLVQGESQSGISGIRGGATMQGSGDSIQGKSFATTNQRRPIFKTRFSGPRPFRTR